MMHIKYMISVSEDMNGDVVGHQHHKHLNILFFVIYELLIMI